MFVGRGRELAELAGQLDVVRRGGRDARGVAVLLRGRRRIGKSRLVEELIRVSGAPSVTFQAARGAAPIRELTELADAIAASTLPGAAVAQDTRPTTLTAALTLLAASLPDDQPAIVVLDEIPWLLEGIPGGAGELQRVWDRALSRKPVLLLLVGSDLTMMEALTRPDAPFYGRAVEMVLDPLTPHDIATMTGLSGPDAFDAYLITGGQPLIAQDWQHGERPTAFLERSFGSSLSALVAAGSRVLDSEFPPGLLARDVLTAIGGTGERTFTSIQQAVSRDGRLAPTSLSRALETLTKTNVVAVDHPLGTRGGQRDGRYRVGDPALRFWLPFVEPVLGEIDRGRPDLAMRRVAQSFESWRGRAIEPVVRESMIRLMGDGPWPSVGVVGGWWPRSNVPEIDLVGADTRPAKRIEFVGTVKWRPAPVTAADVRKLARDAVVVPGVTAVTPLVAVCPGGVEQDATVAASWDADDLIAAWS